MRLLFRSFAVLDVLASVFVTMEIFNTTFHYNTLFLTTDKVRAILMVPILIMLLVGAYGLWFNKKIGPILYYVQFLFRLYLFVFTFGFITLIPEALNDLSGRWEPVLIKVCFVAEVIRLYLTVKGHLKLADVPIS